MKKSLKYGFSLMALVLGILLYMGWASDIPHDVLAEKYAVEASDFVELPSGARAHYRIQGNDEGKTLVLLHGSNASLHTWEPWVEALEAEYLVVTIDLPGHGLTGSTPADDYSYAGMVAFLREFTETIGLNRFVLGGNSMGGAVTLHYALAYPDQLDGLVLLDAAGIPVPASAGHKINRPIAFDLAGRWYSDWILENVTPRGFVTDALDTAFTVKNVVDDKMIDRYWELVRHPGNRRATGLRFTSYRLDKGTMPIENIKLPTLILWGEDDSLIPVEVGFEFERRIKGSQLIVFPGVGHTPMEEIPEKSAIAAATFLRALPHTPE